MKTLSIVLFLISFFVRANSYNLIELASHYGLTTFAKLAVRAGLGKTLSNTGPFTVLAPTNSAFSALPGTVLNNTDLVTAILKYHVTPGRTYSSDLLNELLVPSILTMSGRVADIRINVYTSCISAEGSPIVFRDQNATNGVLHFIDRVMYPIPVRNIPTELTSRKNFSTLLSAVTKANLTTVLSANGPFTLFAPTDEAFAKLPPTVLSGLLANLTLLIDVLTYHVVSGTKFSVGLYNGYMPQTIEGKTLVVHIGADGVLINSAKVIESDVTAINGVIHVIDSVLLPPDNLISSIY